MMPPPPWIFKLKAGEYDTDYLIKFSKRNSNTIRSVLLRYGAEIKKVKSGYRNLDKNIFVWKGVQYIDGKIQKRSNESLGIVPKTVKHRKKSKKTEI